MTLEKIQIQPKSYKIMICAACETRKHFECIDCMNDHQTLLCSCDCHDENTQPHPVDKPH